MTTLPILMRNNRSLFSEFFRDLDELFTANTGAPERSPRENILQPNMEVNQDENNYTLTFDIPGVPKENLKVEVADSVLTISGERKNVSANRSETVTFRRSLALPTGITADHVQAHYEHGVLDLVIPKKRAQEKRTIAVGDGRATSTALTESTETQNH